MTFTYRLKSSAFRVAGDLISVHKQNHLSESFLIHQKALKLKEQIDIFRVIDDSKEKYAEINAEQVIDFSSVYLVKSINGDLIGEVKRLGVKSFIKKTWQVKYQGQVFFLEETSVIRSFLAGFLPFVMRKYWIRSDRGHMLLLSERFNILRSVIDIIPSPEDLSKKVGSLEEIMCLALASLLIIIED